VEKKKNKNKAFYFKSNGPRLKRILITFELNGTQLVAHTWVDPYTC